MSTKNIGQVSGVHIGSTPPMNIIMIWYDNTPSQMVHKVYDVNLSQWVVLDKNTISAITYSELVNLATDVGLSVGAWFKISDRDNTLALAVTTTKVQYSDSLGNVLIDDLGTNIQYHVTSSNLSIDDVVGVFDDVNKKLVFQFNEQVPDYTADDFILGKVKRNNIWSLAKYKLSSFLSRVTGNSISWNGGFFFNFNNAVSNILDKTGGVVSKDTYDEDMENVNTAINNVGQENQTIIQNANQAISDATLPTAIYEKALPSDLEVAGAATNISKGDTLYTLISKIQRWINQFKFAKGIRVSQNFKDADSEQFINNDDTVESALSKIQYWKKNMRLPSNFLPKDYTSTIGNVSASELYDEAFSIIQGKLEQIGDISNGRINSKEKTTDQELIGPKSVIDLKNGAITLYNKSSAKKRYIKIDSEEGSIKIKHNILQGDKRGSEISGAGVYSKASGMTNNKTTLEGINNFNSSALYHGTGSFTGVNTSDENLIAGVVGKAENLEPSSPSPAYGGYFEKLKVNGLFINVKKILPQQYYSGEYAAVVTDNLIAIFDSMLTSVKLPLSPYIGCVIKIINLTIPIDINVGIFKAEPGLILRSDGSTGNTVSISPYKIHTFYYIGSHWVME